MSASRVGSPAPYRPEIDGLRAVAVLAVILDHLGPRVLPGGYLGVDVFFVISGFVITASLANRPAASLGDLQLGFYARRIRRLLPALLLFVLITAAALCLVNPDPGQMLGVGWRSLFGSSNLILHRLALEYFRPAIALNPFAHTWSLGVEEQFYLLFPLLIWLSGFARSGRSGSRRLGWLLLPLALASLVLFQHQLGVDQSAAYYLLPGRFWELGAGALTYLALETIPEGDGAGRGSTGFRSASARWPLPPLLLLLALLALFALPLPFGLLPVAAAVLLSAGLLASLRPGTAGHGLLSTPILVFLGLISYSLYVWHWGVLCLARWTVGVSPATIPWLLGLILLLAVLSWRLLEDPLRRSSWWPQRWQVIASGLALAGIGTLALQGLTRLGSAHLYLGDREVGYGGDPAAGLPEADCSDASHPRLLLVGDSHAHHYQAAAALLCRRHGLAYGEAATVGMPYPILHYTNPATGVDAEEALRTAFSEQQRWDALSLNRPLPEGHQGALVLSLRWPLYFDPGLLGDAIHARTQHRDPVSGDPRSKPQALASWTQEVAAIARANPRTTVVLLLATPEFPGSEPIELCRPQWFRPNPPADCRQGLPRAGIARLNAYLRSQLEQGLQGLPNVLIHDPLASLCPPGGDRCPRQSNGSLLYTDADHLSGQGAALVLEGLLADLRRRQLLPAAAPAAQVRPGALPAPSAPAGAP